MKDLIKRIIREELTPSIRRRLKFGDIEKNLNSIKLKSFKKDQPIEESIKVAILSLLYSIMPHEFEDDDTEYYKVWDEIKEYIKDNYTEELTQYFEKRQRDAEEEERNSTGANYIFVKHDKPYGSRDWRGFAEGFKSFDELITKYGHWVDVDWDEVKKKLDSINEYPEDTFSGTMHSRPLRIKSIGDEGNRMGYNFSIIKSMPKDRLREAIGLYESNLLVAAQRRIRNVDELIFVSADEVNVQFSMCEIDEDDFIDATISKTLNTIYWDYFSDVSDSSPEWGEAYKMMDKYARDKYGEKLRLTHQYVCP